MARWRSAVQVVSDEKLFRASVMGNRKVAHSPTFFLNSDGRWFVAGGAAATVTTLRPNSGSPFTRGQEVTVFGKHFLVSTAQKCRFGARNYVESNVLSSSAITCQVPWHTPGTVMVSVSNDGGNHESGKSSFTFKSRSRVSISPSKGPQYGGTSVTVTSLDLITKDESFACHFGEKTVRGSVSGPFSILCVSPEGSATVLFTVSQDGHLFHGTAETPQARHL